MRLLDAKEVSEILQVSVARVYDLARQGILPTVRIGARQIRFEESRLVQWIQHGGRLDAVDLDAQLAPEGLGRDHERSSESRSQGSRPSLVELRDFEPFSFVIECTVRSG